MSVHCQILYKTMRKPLNTNAYTHTHSLCPFCDALFSNEYPNLPNNFPFQGQNISYFHAGETFIWLGHKYYFPGKVSHFKKNFGNIFSLFHQKGAIIGGAATYLANPGIPFFLLKISCY